jgi:ubiquinone/menaquinone biosynthesis C-methylase UbiE
VILNKPDILKYTQDDLDAFLKTLGIEEYASKQNYFRWLEYPLALSIGDPKDGDRVLEIGSEWVSLITWFVASNFDTHVTALDRREITQENIDYVKRIAAKANVAEDRLKLVEGDATRLPFEDESFDLIYCISMMEHIPSPVDSMIIVEIARVLAPGGRVVLSFPFSHGDHIEFGNWMGIGASQRHYNEFTARWRLVVPSELWFKNATAFGETDPWVGHTYLNMDRDKQKGWCADHVVNWNKYWKMFYQADSTEFVINAEPVPKDFARQAGVMCLSLEKKEEKPRNSFFFDPFRFYMENGRVCTTKETVGKHLTITDVKTLDKDEKQTSEIVAGETCTVEIQVQADGDVVNPVFRIAFHDDSGNVIVGYSSYHDGADFGTLTSAHKLRVTFDNLALQPGVYKLTVGAWEHAEPNPIPPYPFDLHFQQYPLKVKAHQTGIYGAVYTSYKVSIEKDG